MCYAEMPQIIACRFTGKFSVQDADKLPSIFRNTGAIMPESPQRKSALTLASQEAPFTLGSNLTQLLQQLQVIRSASKSLIR